MYERKEKETYKNDIMDEIKHLLMTSSNFEMPILANVPKYIGGMEKPEKAQTTSNLRSRFKTRVVFVLMYSAFYKSRIFQTVYE